jgi:hypothetical protein
MNLRIFLILPILFLTNISFAQDFLKDEFTLKLSKTAKNKKYGFSPKTPIKVGGITNNKVRAQNFLNALKGPNGEKIHYSRIGSCCHFKTPNALIGNEGVLDQYEIHYEGLKKTILIYINEYDYAAPVCPKGFTFKTEEDVNEIKKVNPNDLKQVDICNKNDIFSVENFLLKEAIREETQTPDSNPKPIKGTEILKEYFSKNPLKDERAQNSMFRVAIGFVVNCKGEAGNYFIASKGKGDLEELANQVLEIVNNLDIKWIPAQKAGKKVDSYQIYSFTVLQGKLDKVTIK